MSDGARVVHSRMYDAARVTMPACLHAGVEGTVSAVFTATPVSLVNEEVRGWLGGWGG